jgi:hypothetical protein
MRLPRPLPSAYTGCRNTQQHEATDFGQTASENVVRGDSPPATDGTVNQEEFLNASIRRLPPDVKFIMKPG